MATAVVASVPAAVILCARPALCRRRRHRRRRQGLKPFPSNRNECIDDRATRRPGILRPPHPVLPSPVPGFGSRPCWPARRTPMTCTWSRTAAACTRVLRLVPLQPGDGTPRADPGPGDAEPAELGARRGRHRAGLRRPGRGAGAGNRPGRCGSRRPRRTLTPFTGLYFYPDPADGGCTFTSYETGRRYRVTVLSGQAPVSFGAAGARRAAEPWRDRRAAPTRWEIAIEERGGVGVPYVAERSLRSRRGAPRGRLRRLRRCGRAVAHRGAPRPPSSPVTCCGRPPCGRQGFLTRPGVLMSKHWMDKVWSWDHCFNALALAPGAPELAWDQFSLLFDHQDDSGVLPDSVTHSEVLYNFVKPPIHGWALGQLRRLLPAPLPADRARRGLRAAGPLDRLLARPAAAHPATRCRTTSTATTAAGTTPPPSTPSGWW